MVLTQGTLHNLATHRTRAMSNSQHSLASARPASGFRAWMHRSGLGSWTELLRQASSEISELAATCGIDWNSLEQRLPATGYLTTGALVPVIEPGYRGRSAFVWRLRVDQFGQEWPHLTFMTFRHGGRQCNFRGFRWAWQAFRRTPQGLLNTRCTKEVRLRSSRTSGCDQVLQIEKWRQRRFLHHQALWRQASPVNGAMPLLQRRLPAHGADGLLQRAELREIRVRGYPALMAKVRHHQHGLCGYQLLGERLFGQCKRNQDLVIRKAGMKRGALVVVHAEVNHQQWPVAICEGVFTALSAGLAWPGPMAIALDAGNLAAVRQQISRHCVFFADNDAWGTQNVGMDQALQAMRADDKICVPYFSRQCVNTRPTDFNDLLCLEGIEAMSAQIRPFWPASC